MRLIGVVLLLLVLAIPCSASEIFYKEKIFDAASGHESVDFGEPASQTNNCQSSWDGTSIFYPIADEDAVNNKMGRYIPSTGAYSVATLADDGDDAIKAYTSRWFSGDSNYVYVLGGYGTDVNSCSIVSMWRYTIADGTSTYYSGDGYTAAVPPGEFPASHAGQISRLGSNIWFTAYHGGIYKLSGGVITPYTLESDTTPQPYGITSDAHNLYVAVGVITDDSPANAIVLIPDNFTTSSGTSLGSGSCIVTHTKIATASLGTTYTVPSGERIISLVYDSTLDCLWAAGHNGTDNCIWRLSITRTGDYASSLAEVAEYSSGNSWTSDTPDIEVTDSWVGTVFEDAASWSTGGFMLLDKNNSYASTVVAYGSGDIYPWKSEFWPITDLMLSYPGYLFASGMSINTSSNDHFRILEADLNGLNSLEGAALVASNINATAASTTTTTAAEYSFGSGNTPSSSLTLETTDFFMCSKYTTDVDHGGTVTKMSIYTLSEYTTGTNTFAAAIYSNNATPTPDELNTYLGKSDEYTFSSVDSNGWHDLTGGTLSSVTLTANTAYWLCIWADSSTGILQVGRDTSGGEGKYGQATTYSYSGTWPSETDMSEDTDDPYGLKCYYEG